MSRSSKFRSQGSQEAKPAPQEEEADLTPLEAKKVEEAKTADEEAKKAAEIALAQAEKAKKDGEAAQAQAELRAQAVARHGVGNNPRTVGDVEVTCLDTAPIVQMGGRHYCLAKGQTISVHPSHAKALEQKGWVIVRG